MSSEQVVVTRERGAVLDSARSIEHAIERGDVSFSHQFTALYRKDWVAEGDRNHWQSLYDRALASFEQTHGGVERSWYANNFAAGVALTRDGTLHDGVWLDQIDYDVSEAAALWGDLRVLRDRIDVHLPSRRSGSGDVDRKVCLRQLFDLFAGLITAMSRQRTDYREGEPLTQGYRDALADIAKKRDELERTYLVFATAQADHAYSVGALIGTGVLAVVVGLVGLAQMLFDVGGLWAATMSAGAIGAVLSVLQRLTSHKLGVMVEASRRDLIVGGMSRPFVGMLSALALYVLIEGGLVPLEIPEDDSAERFFLVGLAFLAGFSERLAKDAFGAAEASLATAPEAVAPPRNRPPAAEPRPPQPA